MNFLMARMLVEKKSINQSIHADVSHNITPVSVCHTHHIVECYLVRIRNLKIAVKSKICQYCKRKNIN